MNKTTFCLISGWWTTMISSLFGYFFEWFLIAGSNLLLCFRIYFWYKVFSSVAISFWSYFIHFAHYFISIQSVVYFIFMKIFALVHFIFILHFSKMELLFRIQFNPKMKHISKWKWGKIRFFVICVHRWKVLDKKKKLQFYNKRNLNNA